MDKITYLRTHKRKSRFKFELFGFLYCSLMISIMIYYYISADLQLLFSKSIFLPPVDEKLNVMYFSLIFMGMLSIVFNIGLVRMFRTRISYLLHGIQIIMNVALSCTGFFFKSEVTGWIFDMYVIWSSIYFLALFVCFFIEKIDYSKYGSRLMRVVAIIIGSLYIIYAFQIITGLLGSIYNNYSSVFELCILCASFIYALFNSIYMLFKYESSSNVK
ncbi:MAG: hypothetical protein WCY62_05630 [Clostridia bacterium]